jgi:hypothetical protein
MFLIGMSVFCFRSEVIKAMCSMFWMPVTLAMPTGCVLSIRRHHKRRRTWQQSRYSPTLKIVTPSDVSTGRHTDRAGYQHISLSEKGREREGEGERDGHQRERLEEK